jgi:hypothetical protein
LRTRRSFLRSCIAALVAAPIVCRIAEKLPVTEVPQAPIGYEINPEWVSAPYEVKFIFGSESFRRCYGA